MKRWVRRNLQNILTAALSGLIITLFIIAFGGPIMELFYFLSDPFAETRNGVMK